MEEAAWIKLDVLAKGVSVDKSVSQRCTRGDIARRRNVYNTPLWVENGFALPQEIRVGGCVVGINVYGRDDWCLLHDDESDSGFLRHKETSGEFPISYIEDLAALAHPTAARLANIYGGAALAFFSPRSCYFFSDNTACGFCSLNGTARDTRDEFKTLLSEQDIEMAVQRTLADDPGRIEQVMIVGGNLRDLDRGFKHHVALAKSASRAITSYGLEEKVSIHVATMPPRDVAFLGLLRELPNPHVMFNLEVWDPARFMEICPGKHSDYGRERLLDALGELVNAIGPYRAHSILIAGLEAPQSTLAGARALAERGVSPIINIYHSDKHSRIGLADRPSFESLAEVAEGLQLLYEDYPIVPYWRRCGRNAIDREAQMGLFRGARPQFL